MQVGAYKARSRRGVGVCLAMAGAMGKAAMSQRILVVDDDAELRSLLGGYLGEHGYSVTAVEDGNAMRRELAAASYDLVILDLMLPGDDGLALCRELRARSKIPILMLTARGDELDRIIGLEMGADDYLPKPFHPRELLARIRSVLRRLQDHQDETPARALRFAGWTLDIGLRHLLGADGVAVPLSTGEFRLLHALAESSNRVLSRDRLMDALSGREAGPFDRSVDVMISRLRRRLGDDAREPALIKTIRNEGYVLAVPVERVA
jgi:two-component system OmpR family response regulator